MKLILMILVTAMASLAVDQTVYIGTRTRDGRSEGIYRLTFNSVTGALRDVKLAAATVDPPEWWC